MIRSFAFAAMLAVGGLSIQPMMPAPVSALDTAAHAQAKAKAKSKVKRTTAKRMDYRTSSERYGQNHTSRDRGYYSGGRLGR